MSHLKSTVPRYLSGARKLILGIREDPFIMERLKSIKVTPERMDAYVQVYENAVNAENKKSKGRGDQYEARDLANRRLREALDLSGLHMDLVKIALRDNKALYNKVFIGRAPRYYDVAARTKYILEHYHRIFQVGDVLAGAGFFSIGLEDLEAGRQVVLEAQRAKDRYRREMGAAKDYRTLRDTAFRELKKVTDILKIQCRYVLRDRPQLLETLGLRAPAAGFKVRTARPAPVEASCAAEPPVEETFLETPGKEKARGDGEAGLFLSRPPGPPPGETPPRWLSRSPYFSSPRKDGGFPTGNVFFSFPAPGALPGPVSGLTPASTPRAPI